MSEFEINEALASLEMLMSEFFAPTTNNFRKREIENMLENFSNNRDSWKHCLLFLQKSQNQYVLMFILTTLEKIINRQWISISDNEKTEIRLNLMNELMTKHETMPYFIRNKLAALLVSIARYDWPHLYPDFFTNIVELLKCEGHQCIVGLVLAQAASEELGAARDTGVLLLSTRKSQLERLMLKGMPQMLSALSAILERNAQKEGQSNPPPSPTSGMPQTSALPDLLANAHDVHSADKALNMEIVVKCLTTLQHLFLWLPLSSHVPPSLVTTVFYWGSVATQSQSVEAALAGLGGVCELLYRRYAPPSSAATALRLHHCALRLLRHLTQHTHHMHRAHVDYLNKLAEFLKLFVSLHFKRLEAEPEFDAIDFLTYLFQYTFQVPTCTTFVSCLDVWIQFIDVLKPEDTPKYWEALQALVNGILNKIQFQHNKAQLQHLDNDSCDDDGETEWQKFLKHCIECIARVADLAPLDVFTAVMERWQCLAGVHARAAGRGAGAGADAEAERLLAALLDLATLTRVLGRLAPSLLAEPESSASSGSTAVGAARGCAAGAALVERCASALAGAALTRPHRTHPVPALARAHVMLHAEMFACMGAWCCYAAECGVPLHTMDGLLGAALPFLVPHDVPEPPLLCHAAAHLLLSLSKNVKFTTDLMAMLGDLFNHAQRSLHYLEPKTAGVVREALVALALARGAGGHEAARALLAAWSAALPAAGPAAALPPLTALLHAFADAPTAAKKIIAEGVCAAAESALRLLCAPACAADAEITDFFLALFTALLPQLGAFAYTAIDVFLDVAQRGDGDGAGSLERLVECVRLGVEAGGGGVRVHAVLQLLQAHVLPRAHAAAPALARAAHRLLASVLVHRWRYFFPHKCEGEEAARRTAELRGALTALGRALLQPDIELLRINLSTLDTLNTKWKLYHKAIFRQEFMCSVLSVLLSGLSEGGARALLRDEALAAVHAMAAVDFAAFRRAFLPHFVQSLPGLQPQHARLLEDFPPDTDLPTFTQNIQRLMNDVNCYRTYQSLACNTMGS
ncbi:exportin-6 isoform X2 [Bicyclus anynana]|uniref:Exportin-6 isoform X2 n=1 Tax=Bicyclus anynana TaxID=110368 RepID=A0ABM3LR69_BICAN|nr:exportin-6 isoform X2 [Bicyclus anynana]